MGKSIKNFIGLTIFISMCLFFNIDCKKENTNTLPKVSTTAISNLTSATAISGGTIESDGGSEVTAKGVCWSKSAEPTTNDNKTVDNSFENNFNSVIKNLSPNTSYYLRAYATNNEGTGYGNTLNFTTQETFTDVNGNVYNITTIGTQTWMAENLKTSKFRNGDIIPNYLYCENWDTTTNGVFCKYDNNSGYGSIYGNIYNWYALADTRNIAPEGWHVATEEDWNVLIEYLGGIGVAGGKIKEAGTSHWEKPNSGATNETGFNARPGGNRFSVSSGGFEGISNLTYWWLPSEVDKKYALCYGVNFSSKAIIKYSNFPKNYGFYVRCVKDK